MRIWFIAALLFFSLHVHSTDLFEDAVQLKSTKVGTMHATSLMWATDTDYCRLTPLTLIYRRVSQIRFCAVT